MGAVKNCNRNSGLAGEVDYQLDKTSFSAKDTTNNRLKTDDEIYKILSDISYYFTDDYAFLTEEMIEDLEEEANDFSQNLLHLVSKITDALNEIIEVNQYSIYETEDEKNLANYKACQKLITSFILLKDFHLTIIGIQKDSLQQSLSNPFFSVENKADFSQLKNEDEGQDEENNNLLEELQKLDEIEYKAVSGCNYLLSLVKVINKNPYVLEHDISINRIVNEVSLVCDTYPRFSSVRSSIYANEEAVFQLSLIAAEIFKTAIIDFNENLLASEYWKERLFPNLNISQSNTYSNEALRLIYNEVIFSIEANEDGISFIFEFSDIYLESKPEELREIFNNFFKELKKEIANNHTVQELALNTGATTETLLNDEKLEIKVSLIFENIKQINTLRKEYKTISTKLNDRENCLRVFYPEFLEEPINISIPSSLVSEGNQYRAIKDSFSLIRPELSSLLSYLTGKISVNIYFLGDSIEEDLEELDTPEIRRNIVIGIYYYQENKEFINPFNSIESDLKDCEEKAKKLALSNESIEEQEDLHFESSCKIFHYSNISSLFLSGEDLLNTRIHSIFAEFKRNRIDLSIILDNVEIIDGLSEEQGFNVDKDLSEVKSDLLEKILEHIYVLNRPIKKVEVGSIEVNTADEQTYLTVAIWDNNEDLVSYAFIPKGNSYADINFIEMEGNDRDSSNGSFNNSLTISSFCKTTKSDKEEVLDIFTNKREELIKILKSDDIEFIQSSLKEYSLQIKSLTVINTLRSYQNYDHSLAMISILDYLSSLLINIKKDGNLFCIDSTLPN